jgi:hypothetical protein
MRNLGEALFRVGFVVGWQQGVQPALAILASEYRNLLAMYQQVK